MATLEGQTIAGSYKDLLQVSNSNSGVDATARAVSDGEGTATLLYVSTTEVYNPGTGGTSNTAFGQNAGDALEANGNYNAVFGHGAGSAISTGDNNIAIGYNALLLEDTSQGNIAIGASSLAALNDGSNNGYNIAIGNAAMDDATVGYFNIAIGKDAGGAMSTAAVGACVIIGHEAGDAISSSGADGTVVIGRSAGGALTSGVGNVAIGYQALSTNTDGDLNTAVGYQALMTFGDADISDGDGGNTAVGWKALTLLDTAQYNTAVGAGAGDALTTGGSNVIVGSGAGGTTQDVDKAVIIGASAAAANMTGGGYADGTVAIGYSALSALTSGIGNVAIGYQALDAEDDGGHNTAVGHQALTAQEGTTGEVGNTAVGYNAGLALTSGRYNTAIGMQSLYSDDLGDTSTAVGFQSLANQNNASQLTTGNTGVGMYSGLYNVTGTNNTYLGYKAGFGVSGNSNSNNTAVGKEALLGITDGAENTVVGAFAGDVIAGADNNTIVGSKAGGSLTGGSNTLIGFQAGTDTTALTSGAANVCIGVNVRTSAADSVLQMVLGNDISGGGDSTFRVGKASNYITVGFESGAQTFTVSSDRRKKRNINDNNLGLDFINDIKTKTFQWKPANEFPEEWKAFREDSDGNRIYDEMDTETLHYGLIAQDVKESMEKFDADKFPGWNVDPKGIQEVSKESFVIPLIKAVQELTAKVKELESKLK